jgi:hypothetical protein
MATALGEAYEYPRPVRGNPQYIWEVRSPCGLYERRVMSEWFCQTYYGTRQAQLAGWRVERISGELHYDGLAWVEARPTA